MEREVRTLTTADGLTVVARIERLPRQGALLDCTRAFEVINTTQDPVLLSSVLLRGAGVLAASRPPYQYELMWEMRAGGRVTVLDDAMFRTVMGQAQVSGAVRPFERRLSQLDPQAGPRPQVQFRVRRPEGMVDIAVPVLQLGSDALGRLFHIGPRVE